MSDPKAKIAKRLLSNRGTLNKAVRERVHDLTAMLDELGKDFRVVRLKAIKRAHGRPKGAFDKRHFEVSKIDVAITQRVALTPGEVSEFQRLRKDMEDIDAEITELRTTHPTAL